MKLKNEFWEKYNSIFLLLRNYMLTKWGSYNAVSNYTYDGGIHCTGCTYMFDWVIPRSISF